MKWLLRLIQFVYRLPNREIKDPDLIVPLGYGLTTDNDLPSAEKTVLQEAYFICSLYRAQMAWASSTYFFQGSKELEDQKKLELCNLYSQKTEAIKTQIIASGITNSVTEAREIRYAVRFAGLNPQRIVVVLDWPHARSAKLIWTEIFPNSEIIIHSVEGHWDPSHRATLQKSDWRWLFACILRHLALRIMGLDWVASKQHPTK